MTVESDEDGKSDSVVEILQDAAAVVESPHVDEVILFTERLQSCQVGVFECVDAVAFIHDSGQLLLEDVVDLVRQLGEVKRVWFAGNPNAEAWKLHTERRAKLWRALKWRKVEYVRWPTTKGAAAQWQAFHAVYSSKEKLLVGHGPSGSHAIPDRAYRQAVLEINNFFAPPRSQTVPLDVQYRQGAYAAPMKVQYGIAEITETILSQPTFFFQNLAFLRYGHEMGAISLPPALMEWVYRVDADRLRVQPPYPHERQAEAAAFGQFREQLAADQRSVGSDDGEEGRRT